MGFLDWFKNDDRSASPDSGSGGDLEARLVELEDESRSAGAGFQWGALNRAGDLCLREGDIGRALRYYGRTIDTLLADGQREAARGVANKIIRVHPHAVRTLCTLTWLDLAARHHATALLHVRDYVEAAEARGQEAITAEQIFAMARVSPDEEFLAAAADALDQLAEPEKAGIVRDWAGSGGSPEVVHDPEERARVCLMAAIGSNERKGEGTDEPG